MTKTAFVPAEYNPFHEGHRYQIETLRNEYGFDRIVTVMSGDFVQRGGPAICSKKERARAAIEGGSDLVLLLPYVYSAQTAEMFAWGAAATAFAAGCTDLCFGAEDPDCVPLLRDAVSLLGQDNVQTMIRLGVRDGLPYAAARIGALSCITGKDFSFMKKPNNILAFEYLRAIDRLGASMSAHPVPRKAGLPSASDIRDGLMKDHAAGIRACSDYVSELRAFILLSDPAYLSSVQEEFHGMVPRLYSALPLLSSDIEKFIEKVNTPTVTSSRVRRYLFNMLMSYTKDDFRDFRSYVPGYIRVLALNEKGAEILKELKQKGGISIVTKPSDALKNGFLAEKDRKVFDFDIKAEDLYSIGTGIKGNELRYTPYVKK